MTLPNRVNYKAQENHVEEATTVVPLIMNSHYPNKDDSIEEVDVQSYMADVSSQEFMSAAKLASLEELHARKNFVRSHKMFPIMKEFLFISAKEGLYPASVYFPCTEFEPTDTSLEEFLETQGIIVEEETEEFTDKLEVLKKGYHEELEKLNRVCNDFTVALFSVLKEQSTLRLVSENEVQIKIHTIQQKFETLKSLLKSQVCNGILELAKTYRATRKNKRALPKKAAEELSKWFYEHLNDPYPTEEEKSMLASQCGLTLVQVNNWFGNKRIRYKRKCLQSENCSSFQSPS
jgi:hypothetical protein